MKKERTLKKKKLHILKLTNFELAHLRDLMSISLPPDISKTMSQALAEHEDRLLVEAFLWRKLTAVCLEAGVPMGDDSPDFIVAPSGTPPLSVYQIASDDEDVDGEPEEADTN